MSDTKYIDDYHAMLSTSGKGQYENDFLRLGHPGKWNKTSTVNGAAEYNFTGSNYGVGGIIIETAGQIIHLSNGGTIPGTALTLEIIHELSISKVVSNGGTAYVLYRNHLVK